jgi:hypothetical protein
LVSYMDGTEFGLFWSGLGFYQVGLFSRLLL